MRTTKFVRYLNDEQVQLERALEAAQNSVDKLLARLAFIKELRSKLAERPPKTKPTKPKPDRSPDSVLFSPVEETPIAKNE